MQFSNITTEVYGKESNNPSPFLPLPKSYLTDYLARPVLIQTFFSDADSSTLGVFNLFYNKNIDILKSFKWIRACINIKVVSLGNPTYCGTSILSFRPYTYNTSLSSKTNPNPSLTLSATPSGVLTKLYQLPHILCNFEEYTNQSICLPFSCNNFCIPKTEEMWYMRYKIVNSCIANNGETPTQLEFNVYASLSDVELFGIIEESGEMMKEGVPISGKLAYVSSILSKGSTLFPFLTPWQKLADLSAATALAFGYSRPIEVPGKVMISRGYTSLPYTSGEPDYSTKFSVDPAVARSVVNFHPLSKETDMDLYYHLKHFDFLANNLTCWPVNPQYNPFFTNVCLNRLVYFSSMYKYWTGKLKYRLEFVGNSLLRQNFAVVILPPGVAKLGSYTGTHKLETFIVEVCGRTVFEFEVPYLYTQHLQETANTIYSPTLNDPPLDDTKVQILPITQCSGYSGTPTDIRVNVFVAAGTDFEVSVPSLSFHNNFIIEESKTIELTAEKQTNLKQLLGMPCLTNKINPTIDPTEYYGIPALPIRNGDSNFIGSYANYLERVSAPFVCATGSVRHKFKSSDSNLTKVKDLFFVCDKILLYDRLKQDLKPFGMSNVKDVTEFEVLLRDRRQFFDPNRHFTNSQVAAVSQSVLGLAMFNVTNDSESSITSLFYDYTSAADDYIVQGFLYIPTMTLAPPGLNNKL